MSTAVVLSLALVLISGNTSILAASLWARATDRSGAGVDLRGVANLEAVDDKLWRGAAPTRHGYEALAEAGVETIVDLRAEAASEDDVETAETLGFRVVRIPIPDGHAPAADQVESFLEVVATSRGRVFVHCGAGVGRTGTMAAAYLVDTGAASPTEAMFRNLAVGPPSLEQLAFVDAMGKDSFEPPSAILTGISRFLDAPRRLIVRLGL